MLRFFRRRRRDRLRREPFPDDWREIVRRNVPLWSRLPEHDREKLLAHARVLLEEKHFEGAGGLELTDEIRVTVAAQAALLLLNRETDYFPRLRTILVYPSTYVIEEERPIAEGIFEEGPDPHFGHTQAELGALVLAWDEVLGGAADPDDGVNLVLHEFAHQLDFEDEWSDGTPALGTAGDYRQWARVLGEEFDRLRAASDAGQPTLIDEYGAESPAEFFAVATEAFFEKPRALRWRHPELYEQLRRFYRQDPATYA